MNLSQIQTLDHNSAALAFESLAGASPTFLWLGGFKSDMGGTKAQHLAEWAAGRGQAFVRFDYSGHGRSGGRFEDGAISRWLGDSLAIIDQVARGPIVIVGSSMGAWLALLAARARPSRIIGLVLIAPAVDFTERLMWASFSDEVRRQIMETGSWDRPSPYDPDPYPITRTLIEDGRANLLMDAPIPFDGPVHILQGGRDPDVPEAHARALASQIRSPNLAFELIPEGDHRLSRPQDLARLTEIAADLADRLAR